MNFTGIFTQHRHDTGRVEWPDGQVTDVRLVTRTTSDREPNGRIKLVTTTEWRACLASDTLPGIVSDPVTTGSVMTVKSIDLALAQAQADEQAAWDLYIEARDRRRELTSQLGSVQRESHDSKRDRDAERLALHKNAVARAGMSGGKFVSHKNGLDGHWYCEPCGTIFQMYIDYKQHIADCKPVARPSKPAAIVRRNRSLRDADV